MAKTINLSKLTTAQLEKKIGEGKLSKAENDAAIALLQKRAAKIAGDDKKAKPSKKATPEEVKEKTKADAGKAKKEIANKKDEPAAKKKEKPAAEGAEKAPKTIADLDFDTKTVSGLVKSMLMPKEKGSTVAGCTYSEANKAVLAKFKRKLHTSEFQRNFDMLSVEKGIGILTEKLPPRYKSAEEQAAEEKKDKE